MKVLIEAGGNVNQHANNEETSILMASLQCQKGRYGLTTGAFICDNCGKGKWSNQKGQNGEATCTSCVPGKWSDQEEQISIDVCTSCESVVKIKKREKRSKNEEKNDNGQRQ